MPTKRKTKTKTKTKPKRKPQRGAGRKTDMAKKGLKYVGMGALGLLALHGLSTGAHIGRIAYNSYTSPNHPRHFIKN